MILINKPIPESCTDCFCCYDYCSCSITTEPLDFDTMCDRRMDGCPLHETVAYQHSCFTCLRQGCAYRDGTVRVNCPLWKESAV